MSFTRPGQKCEPDKVPTIGRRKPCEIFHKSGPEKVELKKELVDFWKIYSISLCWVLEALLWAVTLVSLGVKIKQFEGKLNFIEDTFEYTANVNNSNWM